MINCLWTALCLLGVVFTLAGTAYAHNVLPADQKGLDRFEFRMHFRSNSQLSKADFKVLPNALRKYLHVDKDWEKSGILAFSVEIRRNEYLIVLKETESSNYPSKAVVITCCKRSEKSREASWNPLFLAVPVETRNAWSVSIADHHWNLEWNEDIEAVQSTYCSDIGNYACVRHTSKIRHHRQDLIAIEIDETRWGKSWKTIWDRGKWLIDPNEYDLTIRE